MSRNRFARLFSYDLTCGFRQNAIKIAAGVILLCFLCAMTALQFNFFDVESSFTGYVAGILSGAAEHTPQEGGDFAPPVSWLVLNLFGLFLTCTYLVSDLRASGKYVMLLSANRAKWWLSKCLWIIMCSLLYYVALYLIILAGCLVIGSGIAAESSQVFDYLGLTMIDSNVELLNMLLLPVVAFAAMALLQATVSLMTGPVIGYGVSIILLVLSAYFKLPWLIGNFMMLARLSPFVQDGLNPITGYIISLSVTLLAIAAGTLLIKNRDILE